MQLIKHSRVSIETFTLATEMVATAAPTEIGLWHSGPFSRSLRIAL